MTDQVQIETRLVELRREYQAGESSLRELVQRETALRETLLRISGAIQILEELSTPAGTSGHNESTPSRGDGAEGALGPG